MATNDPIKETAYNLDAAKGVNAMAQLLVEPWQKLSIINGNPPLIVLNGKQVIKFKATGPLIAKLSTIIAAEFNSIAKALLVEAHKTLTSSLAGTEQNADAERTRSSGPDQANA